MTRVNCFVFLVFGTLMWNLASGGTDLCASSDYTKVSCIFNESCILPCRFVSGEKKIDLIQWKNNTVPNSEESIHEYYNDEDQLQKQFQRFKKRTSLFKDQISSGNASLLLKRVEVQDQGGYLCSTSASKDRKESIINVVVDAPVSEVNIQQVDNTLVCSSDGIFPEPELTWSTRPPSDLNTSKTEIFQTDQQLFNISSSLMISNDANYSCTICTRNGSRCIVARTTTTQRTTPSPTTKEQPMSLSTIIGIAVAVAVAVGVIIVLVAVFLRRRKLRETDRRTDNDVQLTERERPLEEEEPLAGNEDPAPTLPS